MNKKVLPKIEVRKSTINGNGVFAAQVIPAGTVVLQWDLTDVIMKSQVIMLPLEEQKYIHPIDDNRVARIKSPERFVNHSCNNNTQVEDYCDVAIRDIMPGEEITSDYSSDGSGSKFACSCGAVNCRGQIG